MAKASHGELPHELAGVISAVNTGIPLAGALTDLAADLQLAPFSRTVDHIIGALERVTPLAEVLRAQAQDSRDEAKRELLEVAGKRTWRCWCRSFSAFSRSRLPSGFSEGPCCSRWGRERRDL